jgi:hypothetical protein
MPGAPARQATMTGAPEALVRVAHVAQTVIRSPARQQALRTPAAMAAAINHTLGRDAVDPANAENGRPWVWFTQPHVILVQGVAAVELRGRDGAVAWSGTLAQRPASRLPGDILQDAVSVISSATMLDPAALTSKQGLARLLRQNLPVKVTAEANCASSDELVVVRVGLHEAKLSYRGMVATITADDWSIDPAPSSGLCASAPAGLDR